MSPETSFFALSIFLLMCCTPFLPYHYYKKVINSDNKSVKKYTALMAKGGKGGWLAIISLLFALGLLSWGNFIFAKHPEKNPIPLGFFLPFTSGYALYLYGYYANKLREDEGNPSYDPYKFFMFVAEGIWAMLALVLLIAIIEIIQ